MNNITIAINVSLNESPYLFFYKIHERGMIECQNCCNVFTGKVCNQCGEKYFNPSQLGIKYFLHHSIDVFTHFENKVLKSIVYLITKPGHVVKENLRGVRVPYAKPVQLFIVVNLFFYLV